MPRPLYLKGPETVAEQTWNQYPLTPGTSIYGLQEMSDDDIDDGIIYLILSEFAKTDASNPQSGELTLLESIGNRSTTLTGTFIDTTREFGVGTRGLNVTRNLTQSTGIYQYFTNVSETSVVRPLTQKDDNPGELRPMTNDEIFNFIIDPAIDRMTNYGLGSYYLTSATSFNIAQYPGTWTEVFSFNDTYKSGTESATSVVAYQDRPTAATTSFTANAGSSNQTVSYRMYRKTSETAPTSRKRPIVFANTSARGKHIREMTDAEIRDLVAIFRNKINETTRGIYRFSTNIPTGGTWASRSVGVTDLLNIITAGYYQLGQVYTEVSAISSTFISTYSSTYTGSYSGPPRTVFFGGDIFDGGNRNTFTPTFSGTYTSQSLRDEPSIIYKTYQRASVLTYQNQQVGNDTLPENTYTLWVKRTT
jgi:hypothetical protein